MSRVFSKNKKELAGVRVISASEAWIKDKNNILKLNSNLSFVGKVDTTMPNMVLKANRKACKTAFVEDVSALPKRTKNEIVDHFYDKNGNRNKKVVAYLVRTDNQNNNK